MPSPNKIVCPFIGLIILFCLGCKVKKNRHEKETLPAPVNGFHYIDIKNVAISWSDRDRPELTFKQIKKKELSDTKGSAKTTDSIVVYNTGHLISTFSINGNYEIQDNLFIEKDIDGKIMRRDSLFHGDSYIGEYTYYGHSSENSVMYFNDFLAFPFTQKTFYNDGGLQQLKINSYQFTDSLTINWGPEGIMSRLKNNKGLYEYYGNGVLKSYRPDEMDSVVSFYSAKGILQRFEKDTSILGNNVHEISSFFSNGVLQTVKYYMDGSPCHVWREYNPDGSLLRTLNKRRLTFHHEIIELLPPNDVRYYVNVMSMARVIKGYGFEREYMDESITPLLHGKNLKGIYKVRFSVMSDGMVKFIDMSGYNYKAMEYGMQSIINNMNDACPWRPGMRNGMEINSEMELTFEVLN